MNQENFTAEHEELAIDSVEGMAALLEYAHEALMDVDEVIAKVSSAENASAAKARADAAFSKLQSQIEKHSKVLDLGGFLTEDDTDEIQALYNEIATVEDELVAEINKEQLVTDEQAGAEVETAGEEVDMDEEPEEEEADTFKHQHEEEAESPEIKNSSGQLSVMNESESETNVKIHETTVDTETIRIQLKEIKTKADTLVKKGELLKGKYQTILREHAGAEESKNTLFIFQQLEASFDNTKQILSDIDTHAASSINEDTELFLLHAGNELDEFEENLLSFEKGLEWYVAPTSETITGDSVSPQQAEPDAPAQPQRESISLHKEGIFSKKNELRPYIDAVVADEHYKRFLSTTFNTPGAFEAYLRREIDSQEEPSKLDKLFGVIHASPFDTLLRDMTIHDIEAFDAQSSEKIREALTSRDMQYETFVSWMKAFNIMKQLVKATPSMTFGELFVRAMVEELLEHVEEKI